MTIKRLKRDSGEEVKIVVGTTKGILLLKDTNKENICLLLHNIQKSELSSLEVYKDITDAKYIGPDYIYELIKHHDFISRNLSRKICPIEDVETSYDPKRGSVRFRKDMLKTRKKVLIIDDSPTIQKLLTKIISSSNEFEVMAVADRPSVAKKIIEKQSPDLITLDIHMPEMTGVEFLKTYLGKLQIPTALVSSVSVEEGPMVMDALSNGACTYIQKPSLDKISEIAPEIIAQLRGISENARKQEGQAKGPISNVLNFEHTDGLILIGSSTGGTRALQEIFTKLPKEIPPVVVVQHIPEVFSKALAERLNSLCPFNIKEAEDGDVIEKNCIYIAPGGKQMKLIRLDNKLSVRLNDDPPVNRFKPSVDYLFNSVADLNQNFVLAAVLTGMGKDGAKGLLRLKEAGVHTIAQDKASSIVFGMPKEAIELGAAKEVVSLHDMPHKFIKVFNTEFEKKSA